MKKLTLLIASSFLFYASTEAQTFSGGIRLGGSNWINIQDGLKTSSNNYNPTLDKEIFIRYKTKGKITLEATMGHYGFNNNCFPDHSLELPNNDGYQTVKVHELSTNIEWNLSAQYNLTCEALSTCPIMKHFQSYVGIILTPTLSFSDLSVTSRKLNDGSINQISTRSNDLSIWAGISHTLIYHLNKDFYLSSVARLQFDPNGFFGDSGVAQSPNLRLGLQIGAGYNFK